MLDKGQIATIFATTFSVSMTIACAIFVCVVYRDISLMYYDMMEEAMNFKVRILILNLC